MKPLAYRNRHRLDLEVVNLVRALNSFPGIRTTESCCGHGHTPFWIWFRAESLECLPPLLWWFRQSNEKTECPYWEIKATTSIDCDEVHFKLQGPVGERAYTEAEKIATMILERRDKC